MNGMSDLDPWKHFRQVENVLSIHVRKVWVDFGPNVEVECKSAKPLIHSKAANFGK